MNKNYFSVLPTHIYKLIGLKILNIATNPLQSITPAITSLNNLVDLDIKGTLLTQLPHSMGDMLGLATLSLDSDKFQSYTKLFCDGNTSDKCM
jgi:Leucine-rich repeat (LRR) protein